MARLNRAKDGPELTTHEGAPARRITPEQELRRSVMSCLLWEGTFYESGEDIATRIVGLCEKVDPKIVGDIAVEARNDMKLRHVPLLLAVSLAKAGHGHLLQTLLPAIIQRPDEMSELLAIYWKDGRCPLASGLKRGLAATFPRFNEYQLAKWNRDDAIKLRDVLFLCHAKPQSAAQAETWKKLIDGTLKAADTWEVALSAGKDKKATWERLLSEGKLGDIATLMNLRNMLAVGVNEDLIRARLAKGIKWALPFRFITAARYAPRLEPSLESAMLGALADAEKLPGRTVLLVDVSGSMNYPLSDRGETTRIDAACGLAILVREIAEDCAIYTFSDQLVECPSRRGFALRDSINSSQHHRGTYLGEALVQLPLRPSDRLVVITDEQSHDAVRVHLACKNAYCINVGTYERGVGYGGDWLHIDGWSENVVRFIQALEMTDIPGG